MAKKFWVKATGWGKHISKCYRMFLYAKFKPFSLFYEVTILFYLIVNKPHRTKHHSLELFLYQTWWMLEQSTALASLLSCIHCCYLYLTAYQNKCGHHNYIIQLLYRAKLSVYAQILIIWCSTTFFLMILRSMMSQFKLFDCCIFQLILHVNYSNQYMKSTQLSHYSHFTNKDWPWKSLLFLNLHCHLQPLLF